MVCDDLVASSIEAPSPGARASIRSASSLFTSCFSVISTGTTANPAFEPTLPFRVDCLSELLGLLVQRIDENFGRWT